MSMRQSQVWNRLEVFKDAGDIKGLPNFYNPITKAWEKLPKMNKCSGFWRSEKDKYKGWKYATKFQTDLIKAYKKTRNKTHRKMMARELLKYGIEV